MERTTARAVMLSLCLAVPAWSHARPVVHVTNAGELYAAVNDGANTGATVMLAAGVYALFPNPINAGRLELQWDMELQGSPGRPDEVVIDASGLPTSSFSTGIVAPGAIRMGRGSNAIEWLTVQGAVNGTSAISADLIAPGPMQIRVAHVITRGSMRGLDVRNAGAASAGRIIDVDISESAFVNHTIGAGQAIRLLNNQTEGAVIRAKLRGNRSYGSIAGLLAANQASRNARIEIQSFGDEFAGNGNGCVLLGGISTVAEAAEGNHLKMVAHGSRFRDNVGPLPPAFPFAGGIWAVGGQASTAKGAFRNTLQLEFWGAQMEGNAFADIQARGVLKVGSSPAGIGNAVEIALHGITAAATVIDTSTEIGNTVTISR